MSKEKGYIIAPGETILELLESMSMTQSDLASKLGVTPKNINEIIKGKAPITPETALKLEYVFELPASFWNSLESNYREKKLRSQEYMELEKEKSFLKDIPYLEMSKRNWVGKTKNPIEKVIQLRKFFSVASLGFNTELKNKMAFRKSENSNFSFTSLYCWIRYGEKQASMNSEIESFNIESVKQVLPELRSYASEPFLKNLNKLQKILSLCGINLVFEPSLPNTYVNGVSYKLSTDKALIMLSGRNKRDDSLWFTFFHELGHLLKHSKKEIFIDYEAENNEEIEIEADNFARDILIPTNQYKEFIKTKEISEYEIKKFAKEVNVSTGILVGRLQSDKIINWNNFNNLKTII